MKQFIIICNDIKDMWNEIDCIVESKSKYVTHVDNKNMIVTLGDEQYIYRATYSTLSNHSSISGWMVSDRAKLRIGSDKLNQIVVKLTNRYVVKQC
ncbi:hypothetical protein MNY67_000497 [Listeria monocytogenes]|uniref:hypothetical protein n=1 Tax=Listeria monocytogenes TaxID=1639 RepID=UPI00083DF78C|nr:hypothetical protein [Listeria monocytogenes]EAA0206898.1 hypothetical protein [Listeria monocytogenes]EAA0212024.1 hypothetical protein [Listeria monocytogenes]EAC2205176.1 hypothetical protein [Listeria monocytogenes]EAC3333893.1 hypothetical protein [Listeria monocytogenes]EAC5022246.1 hypothetical protein [Listeria monocytogenes]